jgi:hypothetical protein
MDPNLVENMLEDGRSDAEIAAFVHLLGVAEAQSPRGRIKNRKVLAGFLGRHARHLDSLLRHGDLIELPDGRLYVEGWDEWQEGDWKVAERARRIRNRDRNGSGGPPRGAPATVTSAPLRTVTPAPSGSVTRTTAGSVTGPSDRDYDYDLSRGDVVTSGPRPLRQQSPPPPRPEPTWSKGARLAEEYLREAERLEAGG